MIKNSWSRWPRGLRHESAAYSLAGIMIAYPTCLGESGWNLTLLSSGHITCMKNTNCHVYSR